jgi:hypothetical protein
MNGMDAVIQIRARAVKGFSIYADKSRGCAARSPLRASPDAFHSALKIRKREVMPVNQGFLCCANLCALRGGVRMAQQPVVSRSSLRTRGPNLVSRGRRVAEESEVHATAWARRFAPFPARRSLIVALDPLLRFIELEKFHQFLITPFYLIRLSRRTAQ